MRRAIAAIEERFVVPAYASPRAPLWTGAHALLALPLTRRGPVRRLTAFAGEAALDVVTVGRPRRFDELLERLFDRVEPARDAGILPLTAPDRLDRLDAPLIAVEVHRWTAPRFAAAGWTVIPDAVRWVGDPRRIPPERPSRSLRSDLALVARNGFSLEIANDASAWDEFFDAMVLPRTAARFSERGWRPSDAFRRAVTGLGDIHFVRRGGHRVAGLAAVPSGRRLWYPLLGVRADDPSLLAAGAAAAALALSFGWARDHGFERIDAGRTSPFLDDGVQRFKRKWGLEPMPDPLAHRIAVRVDPTLEPLAGRLARAPVHAEGANGLVVAFGAAC